MPIKLANTFNPTTPIGKALSDSVTAYISSMPTQEDMATMEYRRQAAGLAAQNAELARQKAQAPGQIEELFRRMYNPAPVQATVEGDRPTPETVGPMPGVEKMVPGDPKVSIQENLPALAGAMARAEQYSQIGNIIRSAVANAPNLQDTGMIDRSMLGAGDAYGSTIGGSREKNAAELAKAKEVQQMKIDAIPTTEKNKQDAKQKATYEANLRLNREGAAGTVAKVNRLRQLWDELPPDAFGPVAASAPNANYLRSIDDPIQAKRDEIQSLLSDLELDVAKSKMRGQGQITEAERAIARATLPELSRSKATGYAIMDRLLGDANNILGYGGTDMGAQPPVIPIGGPSGPTQPSAPADIGGMTNEQLLEAYTSGWKNKYGKTK